MTEPAETDEVYKRSLKMLAVQIVGQLPLDKNDAAEVLEDATQLLRDFVNDVEGGGSLGSGEL